MPGEHEERRGRESSEEIPDISKEERERREMEDLKRSHISVDEATRRVKSIIQSSGTLPSPINPISTAMIGQRMFPHEVLQGKFPLSYNVYLDVYAKKVAERQQDISTRPEQERKSVQRIIQEDVLTAEFGVKAVAGSGVAWMTNKGLDAALEFLKRKARTFKPRPPLMMARVKVEKLLQGAWSTMKETAKYLYPAQTSAVSSEELQQSEANDDDTGEAVLEEVYAKWVEMKNEDFWKRFAGKVRTDSLTRGEQSVYLNYVIFIWPVALGMHEWTYDDKINLIQKLIDAFQKNELCSDLYLAVADTQVPRDVAANCCQIALANLKYKMETALLTSAFPMEEVPVAAKSIANHVASLVKSNVKTCGLKTFEESFSAKQEVADCWFSFLINDWKDGEDWLHAQGTVALIVENSQKMDVYLLPNFWISNTETLEPLLRKRPSTCWSFEANDLPTPPSKPQKTLASLNFLDTAVGSVNSGGMPNIFGAILAFLENASFAIPTYGVFIAGALSFLDVIFGSMPSGGPSLTEIVKDTLEDVLIEHEVKDMEDTLNNLTSFWNNEFHELISQLDDKYKAKQMEDFYGLLNSEAFGRKVFQPLTRATDAANERDGLPAIAIKLATDDRYRTNQIPLHLLVVTLHITFCFKLLELRQFQKFDVLSTQVEAKAILSFVSKHKQHAEKNIPDAMHNRLAKVSEIKGWSMPAGYQAALFYYFEDNASKYDIPQGFTPHGYSEAGASMDKVNHRDNVAKARDRYLQDLQGKLNEYFQNAHDTMKMWVDKVSQYAEGNPPLIPTEAPTPIEGTGAKINDPQAKDWPKEGKIRYAVSNYNSLGESRKKVTPPDQAYKVTEHNAYMDLHVPLDHVEGADGRFVYRTMDMGDDETTLSYTPICAVNDNTTTTVHQHPKK